MPGPVVGRATVNNKHAEFGRPLKMSEKMRQNSLTNFPQSIVMASHRRRSDFSNWKVSNLLLLRFFEEIVDVVRLAERLW